MTPRGRSGRTTNKTSRKRSSRSNSRHDHETHHQGRAQSHRALRVRRRVRLRDCDAPDVKSRRAGAAGRSLDRCAAARRRHTPEAHTRAGGAGAAVVSADARGCSRGARRGGERRHRGRDPPGQEHVAAPHPGTAAGLSPAGRRTPHPAPEKELVMKTHCFRAFGALLVVAGVALAQTPELPARLKPLDLDGDGRLSAAEFPDKALFGKLDTDQDGFVTVAEIRSYYLKNPPPTPARKTPATPSAPAAAQPRRSPEESFTFLDRDADGLLSESEFEQLNEVVPYFRDNPGATGTVFKQLDANRDRGLSLAEFREFYQLGRGAAGTPPPVAKTETSPPAPALPPATKAMALKADEVAFFEKHIRPVLVDKCYQCHAADAEKIKGGLTLDTRDGIRTGGDGGPAVVPGDPAKSLLLEAIRYANEDLQMPPEKEGGKLPAGVIANFEQWIKMGAPDPREGGAKIASARALALEKGREFWAFQPVKKTAAPAVKDAAWPHNDIDRHLLAAMEAKGVNPVGDAERRALIRRVSFDLTGLPPTAEQIAAFVAEESPEALTTLVDRLLASPQFGERWGRHWLDVARYADSSGRGSNLLYPEAWRYRDYVIAAFNADKPYDQFVREQIAGDLLPAKDDAQRAERIIATGFLALGPKELAEKDRLQFQLDVVDEQLDTLGQAMLGLTVGCARCHDHKFDPIPQRDYYALAGIFRSTETCYGTVPVITNAHATPLVELPAGTPRVEMPGNSADALRAEQTRLDRQLRELTGGSGMETYQLPAEAEKLRPFILVRSQLAIVNAKIKDLGPDGKLRPFAMAVREKTNPADMPLYQRGEPGKPAALVPRGFLQVIPTPGAPITAGSGRRELADWIASPTNPLTARVMANRVWHHLFGRGLVPSVDNFGSMGGRAVNPALLDHLAVCFVDQGWSVKKLIREIVLSHAYQLATTHDEASFNTDPDNALVWRMTPRRLDAESARDAMLAVSGRLQLTPPLGSAAARVGNNFVNPVAAYAKAEAQSGQRSVYLTVLRDQLNEALGTFDAANPNAVTGGREETTTPAQTLFLLNSPIVQSFAESWAKQLTAVPAGGGARIRAAYTQAFGREPAAAELRATVEFFECFLAPAGADETRRRELAGPAFNAFCQALFASAEFRTLN
ncbi:MAG: DUF1549 domain-containing protein [Opitutus sp.]|nr:DUF1549 domain-containing protein [Opitutus sp.]